MTPVFSFDINRIVVADLEVAANVSSSFKAKEICSISIFPIFIKKISPNHNFISEFFIHEGRSQILEIELFEEMTAVEDFF